MHLFTSHQHARQGCPATENAHTQAGHRLASMLADDAGHREPTALVPRAVPIDPYAAWLERVEARSAAEMPPVRWVCGDPRVSRGAIIAGRAGAVDADDRRSEFSPA